MRLLWEESLLGAIGAMIVGATALGMTLLVLEGLFGIDGGVSVIVSLATAVAALETIQRRTYAAEESQVEAVPDPARDRSADAGEAPVAARERAA